MRPWYQNNGIFLLICLLLPPAGLVVLWFRRDFRVIRKISFSIGLLTLTFFHLFTFYGLRIEMAGSGAAPIFTFHNPDSHFDEIEQRQRVEPGTVEAASRPSIEGGAYWTDFRGPQPRRALPRTPDQYHLGGWTAPRALAPKRRRRLCVRRGGGRTRIHH